MWGPVVFPVITDSGEIGTVYDHASDDGGKRDCHMFLPAPQSGVWNPTALRLTEVIVTEGTRQMAREGQNRALKHG